ncbi:macrophage activating glycoprotein [Coprinopsis sp. MPI-PUGE-AT-0042]|nr:macrophage activating glycoprotein [Coprinopsis sp. MPI-PUGE-AT-0042]
MISQTLVALVMGASLAAAQSSAPPAATTPAPAPPAATPGGGLATFPAVPHASKMFTWPNIPYKVDTENLIRGPQHGYNQCNSTTENQESLCQTMHFNSLDDFCLWGPPDYGREVGDIEGIMVAYCSKPGHGTRLIPEGALTGVQWIRTPAYVQAVGYIDQTKINVLEGDWGGEMDPHGADLRGNPMGGLVFSEAWTGSPTQVIEWHLFLGGNRFCFKACDPSGADDDKFCEHIYDRIGCDYNVPNNAQNGTFESCAGDNQDFPGTYTVDGQVMTYTQPEGPIGQPPYTARTPASSDCTTFSSAELFAALPAATPTGSAGASSGSVRPSGSVTRSGGSGTGPSASRTSTGANPNATEDGGAAVLKVSGFAAVVGALSALFLA